MPVIIRLCSGFFPEQTEEFELLLSEAEHMNARRKEASEMLKVSLVLLCAKHCEDYVQEWSYFLDFCNHFTAKANFTKTRRLPILSDETQKKL